MIIIDLYLLNFSSFCYAICIYLIIMLQVQPQVGMQFLVYLALYKQIASLQASQQYFDIGVNFSSLSSFILGCLVMLLLGWPIIMEMMYNVSEAV